MLRGGIRPAWLVACPEMLKLVAKAGIPSDDPYEQALQLEELVRGALRNLGEGPYGRAAAILFGMNQMTRGLLLKDRRRLAASELDVLPSTFRRNYERRLLNDLAVEIWRQLKELEGQGPSR